jgi:hypothetical protein
VPRSEFSIVEREAGDTEDEEVAGKEAGGREVAVGDAGGVDRTDADEVP